MKKYYKGFLGLALGGLLIGAGATAVQGCDDGICGPCGSIASGQLTIAGNAQLDGFFNAVASFQSATGKIKADFDADILALGELYGLTTVNVDAAFVDSVIAAIKADLQANVSGGLQVVYEAPKCEANVNVAVQAQASCEAQAECDVQVDPGEVSVECEGTCQGSCNAECSGEFSCEIEAPGIECSGMCEGSCQLQGAATCEGNCHGDCSGECSAKDGNGKCAGQCSGMCTGTCELSASAQCNGQCNGKCLVNQGDAQCTAEASCRGECKGECSGKCEGNFKPPSASANCEASAKCEAQASAQANASLECTPPRLEVQFTFIGNANAQAAFLARMGEFKLRAIAILQGAARLEALITGKVNGEVVFDPSPVAELEASISGLVSGGLSGDLNIPAGRLSCVIPAFKEAATVLSKAGGSVAGTLQAQAKFSAFIVSGGK